MDLDESLRVLANAMKEPMESLQGDIHSAAMSGDVEEVRRILDASPEALDSRDSRGASPLHAAVNFNQGEVIKLLVGAGADLNARSGDESTPLIDAANNGFDKVVFFLIQSGADLSLTDDGGDTPLHWAVRKGHANSVAILLKTGANANTRNRSGQTPLDLAITMDFPQIAGWLEKFTNSETPPARVVAAPSQSGSVSRENNSIRADVPAVSPLPDVVNSKVNRQVPETVNRPAPKPSQPTAPVRPSVAPSLSAKIPAAPAKSAAKPSGKPAAAKKDFNTIRRELVEKIGEGQLIDILTEFTKNELSSEPISQAQFLQKLMKDYKQDANAATEIIAYARTSPEAREIALGTSWQTFFMGLGGLLGGGLINFLTVYFTGYVVKYLIAIPVLGFIAMVNSGQKILYVNYPSLKNPAVSALIFVVFIGMFIGFFYLMLR